MKPWWELLDEKIEDREYRRGCMYALFRFLFFRGKATFSKEDWEKDRMARKISKEQLEEYMKEHRDVDR